MFDMFSNIRISTVSKRLTPLCYLPTGELLCYKAGRVLFFKEGKSHNSYLVSHSFRERILGKCRFAVRSIRLGVRAAMPVDENHVILSLGNQIYELDTLTGFLSKGFDCGEGVRPLVFTKISGLKGMEDGIYFGGYLGNLAKRPVNIYRRKGVDQWDVVYTFPKGTINHVHNIVSDPFRDCIWILTGDFDNASAIWKVTENFNKVERVVSNNQKYRGCIAYALPEGLLYATDAPFTSNYIYLLDVKSIEIKEVCPIDGSCIYGCKWKDYYVWSTTVEGDGRNMSKLDLIFSRKRGAGIKDNNVHLYMGNLKLGFKEIYKEKKDWLPFYSFQFGAFKFPSGDNNTNDFYFQPFATTNDQKLLKIFVTE